MRWRIIDPKNRQEAAERAAVEQQIEAWWTAFRNSTDQITALFSRRAQWDLPGWMESNLQGIDSRLMWEFGPAVQCQGHRLVITPESVHHLRPLVGAILKRAPKLAGWEFYPYRLAESFEQARATVEGRTGIDISDFRAEAKCSNRQNIDFTFLSPQVKTTGEQQVLHGAFVAAESLLGEELLDKWTGAIQVAPLQPKGGLKSLLGFGVKSNERGVELQRLKPTVDALIASMVDQLPRGPFYANTDDDAKWTLWELQPEQAEDYAEQHDLLIGKSAYSSMWTIAHSGQLFSSDRFSRCGETFCDVKIDGSQGLDEEKFADKSEIEDALDEVLKPNKLGCQIGGGTGLRYSYIDLALADLDRGIEAVRARLRAGRIPLRSWIQFFDSHLAAEWIGIYDETPPPPLAIKV